MESPPKRKYLLPCNTKYYTEPIVQEHFDKLFSLSQSIILPFGVNLRALRKYSGLSQPVVLKGLNTFGFRAGGTTFGRLEQGKCKSISTTFLSSISDYFGLTPFDLIVNDYTIFENIPERVRKTFNMKPENINKYPHRYRNKDKVK